MQIRLLVLLAGLASACSSTPKLVRVDDSLLSGLDQGTMQPVQSARAARDAAIDAAAYAGRMVTQAEDAVELADAELDVITAELDRALVAQTSAEHSGTEAAITAASSKVEIAESREITADAALTLSRKRLDLCEAKQKHADAESRLAEARVERAKGVAVQGIELPAAIEVSVADLNVQVGELEIAVQKAKTRVAEREVTVQKAQNAYDKALTAQRKMEQPEVVAPPVPIKEAVEDAVDALEAAGEDAPQ